MRVGGVWLGVVCLVLAAGCRDADEVRSIPQDAFLPYLPQFTGEDPEPAPPGDVTPTPTPAGLASPTGGKDRTDLGPAPLDMPIRGLIAFPIRREAQLEALIRDIYTPGHPLFRRYMTAEEWELRHAPRQEDVDLVVEWLRSGGLEVPRRTVNGLVLQFTGTVEQFNRLFSAELRLIERPSAQQGGNAPHQVVGLTEGVTVPKFVADRIASVAAADIAVADGEIRNEAMGPPSPPPDNVEDALTPQQVWRAYNVEPLHARGHRGAGVRLGVVVGASFREQDLRDFWNMFGVPRELPRVVYTMERPLTRYREVPLNTEWAGAMAPEAELILYSGPDARMTSMIFNFNEAVGRNEVSVITTSFARREDGEPRAVHEAYHRACMQGAALGITIVSAGGNTAGVDVPSSSPYCTSVGGTELFMEGMTVTGERAWWYSGSGVSKTFAMPWWQEGLNPPAYEGGMSGLRGRRGVSDVALNAAPPGYWFTFLGVTVPNNGTSVATPVFAGILATINSARLAEGKPPMGWLNQQLYTLPQVQRSFRDITDLGTEKYPAGPGWDFPTGWGAPDAEALHRALP